jgi:hypothetical protein
MGLLVEFYEFDAPAPTHDEVWRMLCDVTGHHVQRRTYTPAPELHSDASDWRAAEARGCWLLEGKTTTFTDGKRSIQIQTLLRGDRIFAQLDHNKSPLAAALREAMTRLGGRVYKRDDRKRRPRRIA